MTRGFLVLHDETFRNRAIEWVKNAPKDTRVEFKAPRRTLDQNSLMWSLLSQVASQREHCGRKYTPDQWKILMMHACGREVQFLPSLDGSTFIPWGQSSSDLSKQQMAELIEFIFCWGAQNGVVFHDKAVASDRAAFAAEHDVVFVANAEPPPCPDPAAQPHAGVRPGSSGRSKPS